MEADPDPSPDRPAGSGWPTPATPPSSGCWTTSRRAAAFDFTGYKRASLMRRVDHRMQRGRHRQLRRVPRLPAGAPGGVHRAVQHDPDQRHRLLPRRGGVAATSRDAVLPDLLAAAADRADPGLERRLRLRGGGVHAWRWCSPRRSACDAFRERVKIYATDVDEEALTRPGRRSTPSGARGLPPGYLERVLRAGRRPVRLPQGPAPQRDLRPQRPGAGRPDLAHRPAGLPQHPDVLQRRDAGPDRVPAPLRAQARRRAVPRQGRDAAEPHRDLRAARPQAAVLPQGRRGPAPATVDRAACPPSPASHRPRTTTCTRCATRPS